MNLFYTKRQNIGDQIFSGQRKGTDLGTAVLETSRRRETPAPRSLAPGAWRRRAAAAFVNVPTCRCTLDSCMQRRDLLAT